MISRLVISVFSLCVSTLAAAVDHKVDVDLLRQVSSMPFIAHVDEQRPSSYGNALALNVAYEPIVRIREIIEQRIGRKLDFNKRWDPKGEAHVTTITPPEYAKVLRHGISIERINEIARAERIQTADLRLLGIGRGVKTIDGVVEETYFVIVDSHKLREIRHRIYQEYLANEGDAKAFDPTWFFPHITVGYTLKDIHAPDVYKDIQHSFDERFVTLNRILVTQ